MKTIRFKRVNDTRLRRQIWGLLWSRKIRITDDTAAMLDGMHIYSGRKFTLACEEYQRCDELYKNVALHRTFTGAAEGNFYAEYKTAVSDPKAPVIRLCYKELVRAFNGRVPLWFTIKKESR